jgi:nucleoside-diphosphate-sugar epimerase
MKKILVTGGTGFLGSALVKELVRQGHAVRVLDNDSRGNVRKLGEFASQVEIVQADIRDQEAVLKATCGMELVYHLAFVNGTRFFYEKPEVVLDVGVRGALTTLEAAKVHEIERYVLASSSEVYQTPNTVPTDESASILLPDITNPRYSYAGGKVISELLALNFLRKTDTDCVIFRPHNFIGPDMGFEHVIPELARKIFENSLGLTRKEIDLEIQGSGEETRAFCYVDNGVQGTILCADKGGDGEIYHIGEMRETSILDLVKMIGEILGVTINIVPGPLRAGGTPRRCPDTAKLEALGYVPSVGLEESLQRTVEWYADYYREQSGRANA